MKKCPQCGTSYSDITLSFCLQDGTPLVVAPQADTPTVVLGETETVVPRREAIRVPVEDSGQSQVNHNASPLPEKKRSNTALAVGLTIVGMLILFGIIGVAAIAFLRNSEQAKLPNTNTNISGLGTNYSTPAPTPSPVLTPPRSTTVSTPVSTPDAPPPVLSTYPSTTRLKFARGAYTTSFSGDLNPLDNRSLVLTCRSGQTLSATISSGASCVSIKGGDTSYRIATRGGDNYIVVNNNCSSVVRFSISITVI